MYGIHRYPRPQLQRGNWVDLNGPWEFAVNSSEKEPSAFPDTILVPYPPESKASGIGRRIGPHEHLWYRRTLSLSRPGSGFRLILHLDAVDQRAAVFVNGKEAARNAGGYHAFSADITDLVQDGSNTFLIRAEDPLSHDFPWGKQKSRNSGMWYTPFSGIWQSVWMETVPDSYIARICLTPSMTGIRIKVIPEGPELLEADIRIETPAGSLHFQTENREVFCPVPDPCFWTPETPWLYPVSIRYGRDSVSSYAAIRTVECRTVSGIPRILLNGKPFFFHALLDQGYWPDGICTPPDDSGYQTDILAAKSLGFNTLRKHIRIEPLTFYADCDRLGILVFQDLVNTGTYSFFRDTLLPTLGFTFLPERKRDPRSHAQNHFLEHLRQAVLRLYSSPCIVLWTIFNEGWGQFDSSGCYQALRSLDPDRLIDTASGWFRPSLTDIESRHVYFRRYRFRPSEKPVILTEFGGYTYAQGRHRYGYRFFKDRAGYSAALDRLYRQQILPAVGKGLCGCVYTQLADVEEERNGILCADRSAVKPDAAVLSRVSELITGFQQEGGRTDKGPDEPRNQFR